MSPAAPTLGALVGKIQRAGLIGVRRGFWSGGAANRTELMYETGFATSRSYEIYDDKSGARAFYEKGYFAGFADDGVVVRADGGATSGFYCVGGRGKQMWKYKFYKI